MKKILIVGGSGFVGINFIKKFSKYKKYKIYSTFYKNKNFIKFKNVKYFNGDLRDINFCKKITKNIDEVYMCAAFTAGAKVILNNPMNFVYDNTIMNLNILNASKINNIKKFIFISSSIVYPNSNKKMREEDVDFSFFEKYQNISWMKTYSEIVSEMYKKYFDILIIRPSNLYGPFDNFNVKKSKMIPSLIKKFEHKNIIEVWGTGREIKDYLYIEDFINVIISIKKKRNNFLIVNVASGKSITIEEVVNVIKENYSNKKIVYIRNDLEMIPIRKINNTLMNKISDFKIKTNLKNGIKATINWYKKFKNI